MTPPSIGLVTAKRTSRAALATALCGSLIFSSLPGFAQPAPRNASDLPPPSPAAAPSAATTVPTEPTAIAEPPPVAPPPPVEAAPPPPPAPEPAPVVVAPLPPPPPPQMPMEPAPEAPPPPAKPKLPSYVMWGVGGASLIAGAVFGIIAVSKESSFKDDPTYDKADSVHSYAIASDVTLGLGAILLVSGTVFYFVDDKDDATTQHAQRKHNPLAQLAVSPVLGMKTQGAAVTLKF